MTDVTVTQLHQQTTEVARQTNTAIRQPIQALASARPEPEHSLAKPANQKSIICFSTTTDNDYFSSVYSSFTNHQRDLGKTAATN